MRDILTITFVGLILLVWVAICGTLAYTIAYIGHFAIKYW